MTLHQFIDFEYGALGDSELIARLNDGADTEARVNGETLLHVAVRRRRVKATEILLSQGAHIDALNSHGKTAYAHAVRRGFYEVAHLLAEHGASTILTIADKLAVAVVNGRLEEASKILDENPACVRTGNPEEDRLLADVAGRNASEPVDLLIKAGADLAAPGLDNGSPLHQAAWFGQPENARLLIKAGAPLNIFDSVHNSSPLGWAVHGSRYSGDADKRPKVYAKLVRMLLKACADLHYPNDPKGETYLKRLRADATPAILEILPDSVR